MQTIVSTKFGTITANYDDAFVTSYGITVIGELAAPESEPRRYRGVVPWHSVIEAEVVE